MGEESRKPYANLKVYQQAEIIYDFTVEFTRAYIKSLRTREQMNQAGRSGKQNISEGVSVAKTSKKSEIKLLGVALGSLMELAEDYADYLRQNNLIIWDKESSQAKSARSLVYPKPAYTSYKPYLSSAEQAANAMLCLINQTTYMLSHLIDKKIEEFKEKGGFSESLYEMRKAFQKQQIQEVSQNPYVKK